MVATSARAALFRWVLSVALGVLGVGICVELGAVPNPPTLPFDNLTNDFETQAKFDEDRTKFEETEAIKDGLGPVYNATSCVSCHQNPVSGSPARSRRFAPASSARTQTIRGSWHFLNTQ